MINRYTVTLPAVITLQVEAVNPQAVERAFRDLFDPKRPRDPMGGLRITLAMSECFAVDSSAVIMGAVLDESGDTPFKVESF